MIEVHTCHQQTQTGDRKLVEGCSGFPMLLWANKGYFYSPNYLLNVGYPGNANCSWKITVDPGKVGGLCVLFYFFVKFCFINH